MDLTRTERRILDAARELYGVQPGEPPESDAGPRAQVADFLASAGLSEAQVDAAVARAFQSLREESDRPRPGARAPAGTDEATARAEGARASRAAGSRLAEILGKLLDRLGIRAEEVPRRVPARPR